MRIAIVGAGVAGAYLARRLAPRFSVDIFEKEKPGSVTFTLTTWL